jgi:hypothetical protein
MPPAKKPATRRASRSSASPSPSSPITRKEVEEAAARLEKALDDATKRCRRLVETWVREQRALTGRSRRR